MKLLFVSPHLDDVAFSCGALLASIADAGHDCVLLTCFTAGVPDPQGFALACQTDKGIAPRVDYMALRRAEDERAAEILGASDVVHLPLPEAPHRGYGSAPELFAGVRADDDVHLALQEELARHGEGAQRVLLPQARGNHADHVQTLRAAKRAGLLRRADFYADVPYVLRDPDGPASPLVTAPVVYEHPPSPAKLEACAAYASQLGFQFGGEDGMRAALAGHPERILRHR